MLTLYQFPSCWGMPNPSPFCMKIEAFLKMTNTPYKIKTVRDPRKAPKGKLPFIKDDDKVIADSSFIIAYLEKEHGISLDKDLSAQQKAASLAIQRLIEEHLYWVIVYSRWIDPKGWAAGKEVFFAGIPAWLKLFLPDLVRKKISKTLYSQGVGRHSQEEIYRLGIEDLNALANLLGDKPYFFGDKPSNVDSCTFAFLYTIFKPPIDSPLKQELSRLENLQSHCHRVAELVGW